jgi:hypothetical protein
LLPHLLLDPGAPNSKFFSIICVFVIIKL